MDDYIPVSNEDYTKNDTASENNTTQPSSDTWDYHPAPSGVDEALIIYSDNGILLTLPMTATDGRGQPLHDDEPSNSLNFILPEEPNPATTSTLIESKQINSTTPNNVPTPEI